MKDTAGRIIYVGKAASLKSRVRSYFQSPVGMLPKVRAMVCQIADFDYILTDSEVEALVLECNLIKENRPKYNINLRDDKSYPYIKVTVDEEFPRVTMTRNLKKDGSRYFGPYTDAGAVKQTLKLLKQLFPFRTCKKQTVDLKSRPCLNAHIKQCLAPCNGGISRDEYKQMIDRVIMFLEGKKGDLIQKLREEMDRASDNLEFERAARLRDQVRSLESILEKQKAAACEGSDQDVVGIYRGREETCAQIFFIRKGKIVGREHFLFQEGVEGTADEEVMTAVLKQFYSQADFIPGLILLSHDAGEKPVITEWLTARRGGRVRLRHPQRGEARRLVELVVRNACQAAEERQIARSESGQETAEALAELERLLKLPWLPRRIECFDISNTGGTGKVGSMVVFAGGSLQKSAYRKFKIRGVEGQDDFASMSEVIKRRFSRGRMEREMQAESGKNGSGFGDFPDLVIVDGGKGQLSAARQVMIESGVDDIPAFGLAKEFDYLYAEGQPEPIILPRGSKPLRLLQQIRDEAHRFAITYHRKLRGKANLESTLDGIPGLGPKRRTDLLKKFGSVRQLRQAATEDIAAVPGISRRLAAVISEHLNQQG